MKNKEQMLILVDENDMPTGEYAEKDRCHRGQGIHHRAFVIVLFDDKGRVFLQLRKHVRWDKYWDIAATSHVLHKDSGNESYKEAAERALFDELGVKNVKFVNIGGFNYFAKYNLQCENEYCAVLVGRYKGEKIQANKNIAYDTKWIDESEFVEDVNKDPDKYTPWAKETVKILQSKNI